MLKIIKKNEYYFVYLYDFMFNYNKMDTLYYYC